MSLKPQKPLRLPKIIIGAVAAQIKDREHTCTCYVQGHKFYVNVADEHLFSFDKEVLFIKTINQLINAIRTKIEDQAAG
jgi:hypothetical protein